MISWNEIRQKCPHLYRNGMTFECGPGWSKIIYDLSLKIEKILKENAARDTVPETEEIFFFEMFCVQVKEKYGTLRFYMSCETDKIMELIYRAEALSSQTCEGCGEFGKIRGANWYEVRCDECYKQMDK